MSAAPAPPGPSTPDSSLCDLTVFVISVVGGASLEACRAALRLQGVEAQVLGANPDGSMEAAKPPVPLQRLRALRLAKTPYVALIEDTAEPHANWCGQALDALRSGASAAGGPVAISPRLAARFRALGLCEFGRFAAEAPVPDPCLPGLAIAVERATCLALVDDAAHGLVEADLCRALRETGRTVAYVPAMLVTYAHPHAQSAQLRTRRLHGRLYGATRVAGRPWWERAGRAMATVALPAVLTLRVLGRRRAGPDRSAGVVFWVVAMHAAWAWGEFVGYLTGAPGEGLESWV